MKIVLFCHSLVSDWNHGNAHFLRGVVTELMALGHAVDVYEPADGWSVRHLVAAEGSDAIAAFEQAYPRLESRRYILEDLDLDRVLEHADLVLVHEWNTPDLVERIGRHAAGGRCRLLFHDTHHRSVTKPDEIAAFDLSRYDGVLAFGDAIRDRYLEKGWAARAWTWHEAADARVFRPPETAPLHEGDLVWIGNWGDGERKRELVEFLLEPAAELGLRARVYGVRYPDHAQRALAEADVEYAGWLPNFRVPAVFARYRTTVHVPRQVYSGALTGVPTIRMFEALACGIPLVSAPWEDSEGLFRTGVDFLVAHDGKEMQQKLRELLEDPERAAEQARNGRETILRRHTCAHRARELLAIVEELGTTPHAQEIMHG
ncbi:glycosyltransferase [soil metagenome]